MNYLKQKGIIVLIIAVLLLVSCNPDSIMRTGKFLNRTGVAILGSSVNNAEYEQSLEEKVITGSVTDIVDIIQSAKNSKALTKTLEKQLEKKVGETVVIKDYSARRDVLNIFSTVFNLAANIDEQLNDVSDLVHGFIDAANNYDGTNFADTFAKIPTIGELLSVEDADSFKELLDEETQKSITEFIEQGKEAIMDTFGPYMGAIKELSGAYSAVYNSVPEKIEDLTGRGYVNSLLEEDMINQVFSVIASIDSEEDITELIINTASSIIADMDTLAFINPKVSFDKVDSLIGQLVDEMGGNI